MTTVRSLDSGFARLFRALLYLYPAEFREEYGRELCIVFADRRHAARSFGGLLKVWMHAALGVLQEAPKEHCQMILQDIRYAMRVMRQEPGVTLAAITILALGIGATTLVFSLVNGLLLRPLPYPANGGLVAVLEYSPTDKEERTQINFRNFLDIRARTRLLEDIGVFNEGEVALYGDGGAERLIAGQVTDGFFHVLGLAPLLGRTFTAAETTPGGARSVVIGEAVWARRFGRDPQVLGKTLETGSARYTVVGVMPAAFGFPGRAEIWFPLRMDPAKALRTDYFLHGIARLKPGVTVEQTSDEMRSLLEQIQRENPASNNHRIGRARLLRDFLADEYHDAVITLLAAAGLVLLIACANVSNLLLVKASARTREIAVRAALGASRARLVRQLMCESMLMGLAGGMAGMLLAFAGIPALLSLIPIELPRWMNFSVDVRVLGFALAASLLTSLGFGIAPAFGAFGRDLADAVRQAGRSASSSARQKWLRNLLVSGEVAISVMLLAGAGLMIRSFLALRGQSLGYRPEHVMSLDISYPSKAYPNGAAQRALVQRLTTEFVSVPGVTSAAFTTGVPLNDGWGRIYTVEGHPLPLQDMPTINHVVVAPGYFQTLGIPLLRGRSFTETDSTDPRVVVVTESFARRNWPDGDPIGQRIRFGPPANNEPWHTVVGVVADNRHGQFRGQQRQTVYLPYSDDIVPDTVLLRSSGDPLRLVSGLKARIAAVDRNIAIGHVRTMEEIIDRVSWQDRFLSTLFSAFAAIALMLAAVGLYAVLSYSVRLNTHEIGIRMALGASARTVRRQVLRSGMVLTCAGLAAGLIGAGGLAQLIQSRLFQVSPTDPLTYSIAPVVLLAVALIAAYLPARRATRVDPIIALRHET
jgi:putative ABC transport system permease protein